VTNPNTESGKRPRICESEKKMGKKPKLSVAGTAFRPPKNLFAKQPLEHFDTKLKELQEYKRRHGATLCAVSLCLLPCSTRWPGGLLPCQDLCHD
jgi:hypothetical protein